MEGDGFNGLVALVGGALLFRGGCCSYVLTSHIQLFVRKVRHHNSHNVGCSAGFIRLVPWYLRVSVSV